VVPVALHLLSSVMAFLVVGRPILKTTAIQQELKLNPASASALHHPAVTRYTLRRWPFLQNE
jgi:hypothetical protein